MLIDDPSLSVEYEGGLSGECRGGLDRDENICE
jgi:hypothetical protein